jgi:ribosome biogenesis protein MAK21
MAPRGNSKKAKAPKTFDDASLSQLTAKIAKKLGGDVESEKEQGAAPKGNNNKENGGKRKRQDGPPTDSLAKGPKSKKRHTENGRNDGDKGGQQRPAKSAKTPSSTLLEEIKALGGDENDLELIENVDSDAEEGDGQQQSKDAEAQVDDKFKNELAKFAASLGLEKLREEVVAEEEEEGAEETEEDEAASEPGDEAEEVEVEERPLPPPVQQETTKGKRGKLVSKHF